MVVIRFSPEEKLKIIKDFQSSKFNRRAFCQALGISPNTLKRWIIFYQLDGPDGLKPKQKHHRYPVELKYEIVQKYLTGKASFDQLVIEYRLRGVGQVYGWVIKYNKTKQLEETPSRKQVLMTTPRKTTFSERVTISEYAIAHNRDYQKTAIKFNVSYQQVRNWVKKVDKFGLPTLQDGRGKRKNGQELTEVERLKLRIRELEANAKSHEIEDDFVKKYQELARRWKDEHRQ